ncbi:unnamed protein product [Gongylonema pulchrum]|uniref:Uncharacterized protein n=1 Tax=Gongylonema pulchrum TaxID=637853 RepID=A0A3P6T5H7_9BILA|nr:unnamed protein product [Gongylonema pulchrum]
MDDKDNECYYDADDSIECYYDANDSIEWMTTLFLTSGFFQICCFADMVEAFLIKTSALFRYRIFIVSYFLTGIAIDVKFFYSFLAP